MKYYEVAGEPTKKLACVLFSACQEEHTSKYGSTFLFLPKGSQASLAPKIWATLTYGGRRAVISHAFLDKRSCKVNLSHSNDK